MIQAFVTMIVTAILNWLASLVTKQVDQSIDDATELKQEQQGVQGAIDGLGAAQTDGDIFDGESKVIDSSPH